MKKHVVILDEKVQTAEQAAFVLRSLGFQVVMLNDYDTGLAHIEQSPPQILLFEPFIDADVSLQFCQHIKSLAIPLILYTDPARLSSLEACLQLADAWIAKRSIPGEIVRVVGRVMTTQLQRDVE